MVGAHSLSEHPISAVFDAGVIIKSRMLFGNNAAFFK